jgi:amino acid adenylation domain-containing protein/non-ribosomal peptide synthase protein (TIGR01720 family)
MMNERSIIDLLYQAKQNQVDILLNDGQLQLKLPKNKGLDKDLLERIKENKQSILDFLIKNERGDKSVNKINKADRNKVLNLPLSYNQEGLWFIDQLEGSVSYHLPSILTLTGRLDKEALSFALRTVVDRHQVLRTVIRTEEGTGYQQVRDIDDWQLNTINASGYKDDQKGREQFLEGLIKKPFDLSKDYLLRADLLSTGEEEHLLLITMHHIASDGWSSSILVRELIELYESRLQSRLPNLKNLEIQYSDYAVWQRNHLTKDILDKKLEYWKDKLQGIAPLQLPTDFPRPAVWVPTGTIKSFRINKELSDQLQLLSQKQGCTLFMTLLAAFKVLMYRYSGQQDICIGTSLAGRQQKETEDLIGFFINIVALRSNVNGDNSFLNLLQAVKETTLEAFEHQEVSFGKVVEGVVKERDLSRNSLCQVMFVLQNTPEVPELRLGELVLSLAGYEQTTAQYDIIVRMTETGAGLTGTIQYSTALYTEETIYRMVDNFKVLLNSVATRPQNVVDGLPLLTDKERNKLLVEFNDSAAPFPTDKTIIDLFNEQVAIRPNSPAVIFKNDQISFKELDERSNQLARYLQSRGVRQEMLIPICIERSIEMLVGIFGILKSGAAYVPVDPEYPIERITYMLGDTNAEVILGSGSVRSKLAGSQVDAVIELDTDWSAIARMSVHALDLKIKPGNLCYVIYTSGSTGKPKGVMVEHRGVVNLAMGQAEALRLKPEMKTLQFASFGFDASCYEIFNTLLSGGTLVLSTKEDLTSAEKIKDIIRTNGVELAVLPPSYQGIILDSLGTLKTIVSAGEPLNEVVGRRIQDQGVRLINAYGPTENTVCVSLTDNPIRHDGVIVIGKPIANVKVYILDKVGGLSPLGSTGEICVSGAQVARGYLNRMDLTAEKFIPDLFNQDSKLRIYRTGDLGRWLPDGNIEYQGRLDEQVKIRGYRIELGEIENVLLQSGMISHAVVVVRDDKENHKSLIAYVVPDGEFDKNAVVVYLQSKLPEYMLPSRWIAVESFKLTSSGKIDRKALPDPDEKLEENNKYEAPQSELEQKLVEVWQELLEVDDLGVHDNFFELGGDSILTIQVVSRMRKLGYHLEVTDIFNHQTISALAVFMTTQAVGEAKGEQGVLKGSSGLLPIQQWYFEKVPEQVSHYNQSVLLSIEKSVVDAELKQVVKQLLMHHDALRFKYYQKHGVWQQEYLEEIEDVPVFTEDLKFQQAESLGLLISETADRYQRSLDIQKGRLLQVVLIETPASELRNRLLIVVHHLVIDGVSWRILLEELENLLNASISKEKVDLGTKTSSYRQWHEALKKYGQSANVVSQIPYWQKAVKGFKPLMVDREYKLAVKAKETGSLSVRLSQVQTRNLVQEVPRVYHTEINDMLLCALVKTISDWNDTDTVVIGMEGHGREHIADEIDLTRTVGWFTTLYPLTLQVANAGGLDDLIKTVKEQLRMVPDKGLGYGVLRYINKEETLQKDTWDIQFNYLGQLDNVVRESKLLAVANELTGAGKSEEHDVTEKLSVNSYIRKGELVLHWSYSTRHYNSPTIQGLANQFVTNLQLLISHCLQQSKSGVVYTPSDYGLGSAISYEELDAFLEDDNDNIMSF